MSNLLDQLPALIGVLLGALSTVAATTVADRARFARSQSVRWDERRLEAYAGFARSVKEVQAVLMRLTATARNARSKPMERDEAEALLVEGHHRQTIAWEAVLLLGDEATVAAARVWRSALHRLEDGARADADVSALLRDVDHARDAFYAAARASLGVRGGDVAQLPWLDERRGEA